MGKHNFIIVMTRSATVALGLDDHSWDPELTNDRSNFPRFTYAPTRIAHTQNLDCENTLEYRATKQSAFTSLLFLQPSSASSIQPTRSGVAWRDGGVAYTLAKREPLYPVYARSSNAWPLSCWCNQNEIREGGREGEIGCTSVKINNMSLKKMHLLVESYRECRSVSPLYFSLLLLSCRKNVYKQNFYTLLRFSPFFFTDS